MGSQLVSLDEMFVSLLQCVQKVAITRYEQELPKQFTLKQDEVFWAPTV